MLYHKVWVNAVTITEIKNVHNCKSSLSSWTGIHDVLLNYATELTDMLNGLLSLMHCMVTQPQAVGLLGRGLSWGHGACSQQLTPEWDARSVSCVVSGVWSVCCLGKMGANKVMEVFCAFCAKPVTPLHYLSWKRWAPSSTSLMATTLAWWPWRCGNWQPSHFQVYTTPLSQSQNVLIHPWGTASIFTLWYCIFYYRCLILSTGKVGANNSELKFYSWSSCHL